MTERISANGKCPITRNDCICSCLDRCFIDVKVGGIVARLSQTASNLALDAANDDQLNNLPTQFKLKVADRIMELSKKKVGKPNPNI